MNSISYSIGEVTVTPRRARLPVVEFLYPCSFLRALGFSVCVHAALFIGFLLYISPSTSALAGMGPIFEVTVTNPGVVGSASIASGGALIEQHLEPVLRQAAAIPAQPKASEISLTQVRRKSPASSRTAAQPHPAAPENAGPIGNNGVGGGSLAPLGGSGGGGGSRFRVAFAPKPPYPPAARRAGFEGRVVLDLIIDPEGRPRSVNVAQSSGRKDCDDSASTTILNRWRFEPLSNYTGDISERIAVRYQLQ